MLHSLSGHPSLISRLTHCSCSSFCVAALIKSSFCYDTGQQCMTVLTWQAMTESVVLSLSWIGLRDSVSVMTRVFPGAYSALALNRIKRIKSRWHRTGTASKSLLLISGTSGLWPVISLNLSSPTRYFWNLSQAHTPAKHSFSICAYLDSADVNLLEQYATGFQLSSCNCRRTPPYP